MTTPLTPSILIQKKRDGHELTREEIETFISWLKTEEIADYQTSALLMAIYFQGLSLDETVALTRAMAKSGTQYHFPQIDGPKIDKHSTGGIGDKVSLILAPLAAACGLIVPMMSGRGLGFTGGTLDKLEAIPGFKTQLSEFEFTSVLSKVGCAMTGQTEAITPADRKLYALRDVTGTVESIQLITASILSKKIAEGSEGLILDVKVGSGAFMKNQGEAQKLAKSLLRVSKRLGLPSKALLTNMDQPLGYAVGNRVEVLECIEILRNEKKPDHSSLDLRELTIHLCAQMLFLAGRVQKITEGRKLALSKLTDGSAWEKFCALVQAQGGNLNSVTWEALRKEEGLLSTQFLAQESGYLCKMDGEAIGQILIALKGGRKKAQDLIDPSVGLLFHRKLGSRLKIGDPIATILYRDTPNAKTLIETCSKSFEDSLQICSSRKKFSPLVLDEISI